MSYTPKKKDDAALALKDPAKCEAYGCPCRASVCVDAGKFTCSYHHAVEFGRWQNITRALNDNIWLIEFIDEMRKMNSGHQDWRGFAMQFWANSETACQPHPKEEATPYQNRMRGELMFRVGGTTRRPVPRIPSAVKPGGMFSRKAVVETADQHVP